jgi:hypothetical protein
MIGLAFSGATNAQNIGYIIPSEEIEQFLHDMKDGHYEGKPQLFDAIQTFENPALRDLLKLDKSVEGAIVTTPYAGGAANPLKEWDVITKIGDAPIDNEGMVHLTSNLRVGFMYRVQQLAHDGKVPLTVIRNGQTLHLQAPVYQHRPRLLEALAGGYPSYFVYGPIVFERATAEFLHSAVGSNARAMLAVAAHGSPLVTEMGAAPTPEREELVVVAAPFFTHKTITGYSGRFGAVLESVNGVRVRSLHHLVQLLRDAKEDLIVLRFASQPDEHIVLRRKEVVAATDSILSDNGIRFQGSPDMMDVWTGKTR